MNLKTLRKLAITSTVLAGVVALGASGISNVSAATPVQGTQVQTQMNPMSSLISAIAQKFNLNVSDVQKLFDEQHTQMESQRGTEQSARITERLTQAVTQGKLTQSQADLLKAKQEELRVFHESLKGKTREECKAAMDKKIAELKEWAKANNIPDEFANFGPMGRGPGGRGRGPGGMRMNQGFGQPGPQNGGSGQNN